MTPIDLYQETVIGEKLDGVDYHFRENVRVVLYNPGTKLFALQYSSRSDFYGTLGGGVEPGDTILETVSKELTEETGYVDFEIKCQLGGQIRTFYAFKERLATPFLVYLQSEENIGTKLTPEEEFEGVEVHWLSAKEAVDNLERLSKIDEGRVYHLEVLKRGVEKVGEC
jgi:8-oxo-dGTP pyrophosphatase MutT (NUDIX family)